MIPQGGSHDGHFVKTGYVYEKKNEKREGCEDHGRHKPG